jgi:hypothetical protein
VVVAVGVAVGVVTVPPASEKLPVVASDVLEGSEAGRTPLVEVEVQRP